LLLHNALASVEFVDILHNLKSNLGSKILQENYANTVKMLVGESVHFLFFFVGGGGEFVAVVFQISQNINKSSMLGWWISCKSRRNTSPPPPSPS